MAPNTGSVEVPALPFHVGAKQAHAGDPPCQGGRLSTFGIGMNAFMAPPPCVLRCAVRSSVLRGVAPATALLSTTRQPALERQLFQREWQAAAQRLRAKRHGLLALVVGAGLGQ